MSKDWVGNYHSVCGCIGARNLATEPREENDYYATEPRAVELLLELEPLRQNIWECACGEGHLSKVLEKAGHTVKSTDLIDRGYGESGVDFLEQTEVFDGDILTNPPYKYAQKFVEKALELSRDGHKVCMFLKLTFLESSGRRDLFRKNPPKTIYVSSGRLRCGKNGVFGNAMVAYAWYIWEKGYKGDTTLKWFN